MKKEFQKFWVSQAAVWIKDGKCLILESSKSPGYWGLSGGRIDQGEMSAEAFCRELKEELNLTEFTKIALVDYLVFYDLPSGKELVSPVCAIISLIKSSQAVINNDIAEHLQMAWITEDEIDNYKYVWHGLAKSIKKAFVIYNSLHK